jgi:hypothetical protein
MMIEEIITATNEALLKVDVPRFLRTERGFQGRFYCALQQELENRGLLRDEYILEMEYQKRSSRHGMNQRPDIVLHVPAEESGAKVSHNNLAVWALKLRANKEKACLDFANLDKMFSKKLCYRLGIFVNIDSIDHFATSYNGRFPNRLRTVSVRLDSDSRIVTSWGLPEQARPNDA